ncbi:hypothetical protein [Brevibacillus reuszeri]|uniref:hypothetical protein n=1 Tax=Brevibacillus reuszeri TaxID=54915 RepID=UPI000CCC3E4E|nr:hypothetical protein [Brevibacillus reuszeri]
MDKLESNSSEKIHKILIENYEKDVIHLELPSGKVVKLGGFISLNALSEYEDALNEINNSREAFCMMLVSMIRDDSSITIEEMLSLENEKIISLGEQFIEKDTYLKNHYEKVTGELDFFERFKKAVESQRRETSEKFKKLIPDFTWTNSHIQPLLRSIENIERMKSNVISPQMRGVRGVINDLDRFQAKEDKQEYESVMPKIGDYISPEAMTSRYLEKLIEQQDQNNENLTNHLIEGFENMVKLQAQLIEENQKSSAEANKFNKIVVWLTGLTLGATVIGVIIATIQYLGN